MLIILDRITDVRNFGAIARSAECAGAHAIIIPSSGAAAVNADAVKTSAGALLKIPVCRVNRLSNTIEYLKECGLQIIACTGNAVQLYYNVNLTLPLAIILGSEETGISRDNLQLADIKVKIPIMGEIESLNVSVAMGIVVYEALRQRNS